MDVDSAHHLLQAAVRAGRLHGALLPHQYESVSWMLTREVSGKGGILADDMGLGKTYQLAALITSNPVDTCRSTLIVTVLATLNQWKKVLFEFIGMHAFIVNPNSHIPLPSNTSIVLTTYSTFRQPSEPRYLMGRKWKRIVLDEGHVIKDSNSTTHRRLAKLICDDQYRWIVSGTPVQNNMRELETLLKWVGCSNDDHLTCMMRRTIEDVGSKYHNVHLPEISTKVKYMYFKYPEERMLYAKLTNSGETAGNGLDLMLRLRQACIHPQLYYDSCEKKKGRKRVLTGGTEFCAVDPAFADCQTKGIDVDTLYKMQEEQLKDVESLASHCDEDVLCEDAKCVTHTCEEVSSDDEEINNIDDLVSRTGLVSTDTSSMYRSTKLEYLVGKLIQQKEPGIKSLVFCKFRTEMDILCRTLADNGVCYCRYDGDMSRSKRECMLFNFENEPHVTTMIIQIQAGGVGLNLQCASCVYITAPEWNPVVELQAIARVHRLNQQNSVRCVRLVMAGTVEEVSCMHTEREKLSIIGQCLKDSSQQVAVHKLGLASSSSSVSAVSKRFDILKALLCLDNNVPRGPSI